MSVYRLDIAYDGSGFHGYARQTGQRTVQGALEAALAAILGSEVDTAVAGRTDAGVHAQGQVVSFEFGEPVDFERARRGINGMVGPEISVWSLTEAPEGFNARFSAVWRRYVYRLDMGPAADPLTRGFVWHVGRELDTEAMRDAARAFVGEHDFGSFCRSAGGRSTVRKVTGFTVDHHEDDIELWVQANAFCHQMVRSIVGYLYDVGRGFNEAARAPEVIAARDRSAVATVAPPHGLTLHEVGYP